MWRWIAKAGIIGDVGDGSKRSECGYRSFYLSRIVAGGGTGEDEEAGTWVFSGGGSKPGRLGDDRAEEGGWHSWKQQCQWFRALQEDGSNGLEMTMRNNTDNSIFSP